MGRDDAGVKIIFLRQGCEVLPESYRHQHAAGVILAFTTTGLEAEEARLRTEGVAISPPLMEEPWGERLFQVTDPNGVVIQSVESVTPAEGQGEWTG